MAALTTDAIQWHEGMLLLPQHFQQSDLRLRELLNYHLHQTAPFHWGICDYELDEALLAGGTLHFKKLEAILPDGLVISLHPKKSPPIELDLTVFDEVLTRKPLTVNLVVPRYQHGAPNATGELPRFLSIDSDEVVDENTGQGAIRMPKIAPNVRLLAGDDIPSNFVGFPLFKITKDLNAYILKDYVPPFLKVSPTSRLGQTCVDICKSIRSKIGYLSAKVLAEKDNRGIISSGAEDTIKALTLGLLPFEAQLYSGVSHPYTLYVALCNLAGHMAALESGQMPPVLTPYNHHNILSSYQQVFHFVSEMSEKVKEGYILIPFKTEKNEFTLPLKEKYVDNRMIFGARAPVGMSLSDLAKWIEGSIIATHSFVKEAKENRVRGAPRTIIEEDTNMKLRPAKGVVLFMVEGRSSFIAPEEVLSIFNVSDKEDARPVEIVLYHPRT